MQTDRDRSHAAHIVMVYIVMAYIVMAYIVMAYMQTVVPNTALSW